MSSIISRASGYDFANLWMNMAKILIALIFVYQATLYDQLGVELFHKYFYVFHALEDGERLNVTSPENVGPKPQIKVVTPQDSKFSIDFLPLAVAHQYDTFKVEVTGLSRVDDGDENLLDADSARVAEFEYGRLTNQHRGTYTRAEFDFLSLLKQDVERLSGLYQVSFMFKFLADGVEYSPDDMDVHTLLVRYLQPNRLRYGDFVVVQGRGFPIPHDLLSRLPEGEEIDWGEHRVLEPGQAEQSRVASWERGSVLHENRAEKTFKPLAAASLSKTYEQQGSFLDREHNRVEFTIGFSQLKNEPPRSTYQGKDKKSTYEVLLYYEWYFNEGAYPFFNLSRYIIDPDGVGPGGIADIRVNRFDRLQFLSAPNLPYRLQRQREEPRDWHLIITGPEDTFLRKGESHVLSVVAHDDFGSKTIKITIRRLKRY